MLMLSLLDGHPFLDGPLSGILLQLIWMYQTIIVFDMRDETFGSTTIFVLLIMFLYDYDKINPFFLSVTYYKYICKIVSILSPAIDFSVVAYLIFSVCVLRFIDFPLYQTALLVRDFPLFKANSEPGSNHKIYRCMHQTFFFEFYNESGLYDVKSNIIHLPIIPPLHRFVLDILHIALFYLEKANAALVATLIFMMLTLLRTLHEGYVVARKCERRQSYHIRIIRRRKALWFI